MKNLQKPNYSNWVPQKLIFFPAVLGMIFLGASIFIPLLTILATLFLGISAYFAYANFRFSAAGGNIQNRIQSLLLTRLNWNGQGKALDIGCGNASLTIKVAQKFPTAQVTGIDYWGENWDYSKTVCEKNALLEGVERQVVFQKASASALPFEDESFDLATSNLVFHEVRDTKDKQQVIREALRVVKKGGVFAFQDLFAWNRIYGEPEELLNAIRSWGISDVKYIRTCDEPFIPRLLKLPFMVGKIGILYGEK